MKKISVLFSILAVLFTVAFTGCNPSTTMEPFTEDTIGDWLIGEWEIKSTTSMKMGDLEESETETFVYDIKGIEDSSEVVITYYDEDGEVEFTEKETFKEFKSIFDLSSDIKEQFGTTEGVNYSCLVNKARNKFEMNISVEAEEHGVTMAISISVVATKK